MTMDEKVLISICLDVAIARHDVVYIVAVDLFIYHMPPIIGVVAVSTLPLVNFMVMVKAISFTASNVQSLRRSNI